MTSYTNYELRKTIMEKYGIPVSEHSIDYAIENLLEESKMQTTRLHRIIENDAYLKDEYLFKEYKKLLKSTGKLTDKLTDLRRAKIIKLWEDD